MRTRMLTATLVAAAAVLAACSNGDPGGHNDADVAFAQEMIPHHRQATEMAALAPSRTDTTDVLDLAEQISAAQDPEIETMTGWLESWGEEAPADMGSMSGMESMPGMMSEDQMAQLKAAQGADFDRLFLTMMVEHHEGAIDMAAAEQEDGQNAEAIALAQKIEADQTAEISTMRELLGS